tara:strand:+ start:2435 stop:2656 length:222 start_codon:yes stop_codon:yes gene_type:complete
MTLILILLGICLTTNLALARLLYNKSNQLQELKIKHKATQDYAERIALKHLKQTKTKRTHRSKKSANNKNTDS